MLSANARNFSTAVEIGRCDASRGMTLLQKTWVGAMFALTTGGLCNPAMGGVVAAAINVAVLAMALFKLAACVSPPHARASPEPAEWPTYTIVLAMYDEAAIAPYLIDAVRALDYPPERIQVIAALEADDHATRLAFTEAAAGLGYEIVIPADGPPKTKPRALNAALAHAVGELLVIYDAEDRPHPRQLREAAARFVNGSADLAVVQAPLRIATRPDSPEIQHQFAMDYAALFEVVLPFLARLRLPFPLGGTSNHFRRSALLSVGGWDAWNVTEDADLGFRLYEAGYTSGLIAAPTVEDAPRTADAWIRQRSRWLKGFLQTLIVHTRHPNRCRPAVFAALAPTLIAAVVSAALQGPAMVLVALRIFLDVRDGKPPEILAGPVAFMVAGAMGSIACMVVGARRAGVPIRARSLLLAPVYWSLQTPALVRAMLQLVLRPYYWDKTAHAPPSPEPVHQSDAGLDVGPAFGLSRASENVLAPERAPRGAHDRTDSDHAADFAVGGLRPA